MICSVVYWERPQLCNVSLVFKVKLQPSKPCNASKTHNEQALYGEKLTCPSVHPALGLHGQASCSDPSRLQCGSGPHDSQLRPDMCTCPLQSSAGPGACQGRWSTRSAGTGPSR